MKQVIVTMVFEIEQPLTNEQKGILRDLVEDYQCEIAQAVGMTETEWGYECQ